MSHDLPTESEQIALMLGNATFRDDSEAPASHHVTLRVPRREFVTIQAMASLAGISRSVMINRLIRAGIASVMDDLDGHAADRLDAAIDAYTDDLENH